VVKRRESLTWSIVSGRAMAYRTSPLLLVGIGVVAIVGRHLRRWRGRGMREEMERVLRVGQAWRMRRTCDEEGTSALCSFAALEF
jgi:hypothetical protein